MGAVGRLAATPVAILLTVLVLASCGEDSDTPSSSAPPAGERQQGSQAQPKQEPEADGKGDAAGDEGGEKASDAPVERIEHDDPGGGAEQFRVPGGDNSVQEFGSEATDAEFEQVADTLHAFLDSRAVGDWETACEQLAGSVVESLEQLASKAPELEGEECPAVLRTLSGPIPAEERKAAAVADVGSVRVEGDQAFVLYHGARDVDYAISMVREDGRWKVASMSGVPIS